MFSQPGGLWAICRGSTYTTLLPGFAGKRRLWDPHFGPNGGYHFSNGATAQYDPALGLHGGVRFNNGVTAEYDPSLGPNGGYRYSAGTAVHHVPSTVAIKRCINNEGDIGSVFL
jgi:hypothetical protein